MISDSEYRAYKLYYTLFDLKLIINIKWAGIIFR